MDKGKKRSFEHMKQYPSPSPSPGDVDVYVFSEKEHSSLKTTAARRPKFSDLNLTHLLDANTKKAALKASSFIVGLVSFSGEMVLCQGCGTIIEVEENSNFVMCSLNLIRRPSEDEVGENYLAENLKIVVRSPDKNLYLGEVVIYDFHYNLLIIKFKSKTCLQAAKVRLIDDDINSKKDFQLRPHNLKMNLGDTVAVVGRYFYKPFDLMASCGRFSMDRCDPDLYDCLELLSLHCLMTICGDGSPLINMAGEVIGIVFFEIGGTAYLPINITHKWWDHYKRYKELRHPSYGLQVSNLYVADLSILERVLEKFPSISNGLVVEEVLPGSYAASAGLRENDVILKCDGKPVETFYELWNVMWDKVGQTVELEVDRNDLSTLLTITMVVGEATTIELNKWPQFDYPRRC